jgi:hypothetical protein
MSTLYHTSLMTTDAEVNKYFSSPIGTLATPAVLPRETFDGVSCIVIRLGTETPDYIFAGNGGGTAKAELDASVPARASGKVSHCYAINPADHGRYLGDGTAAVRTGVVNPLYEFDDNHKRVINDLMLHLQTFFDTNHPAAVNDGGGPFVDKIAYPNVLDMTNHTIRLTMRAVDFKYPPYYFLGMHLQGQLAGVPRIGTGNGGTGAFPLVNAMNHADILGQLVGSKGGIYADNTIGYIRDSGFVAVDIPFSPNDSQWTMMFGNEDKDGHEGAAYAQGPMYIGTTAKRLVGPDMQKLNAYLCGGRWNPNRGTEGTNTVRPRVAPDFEPTGSIYVSKIEFVRP